MLPTLALPVNGLSSVEDEKNKTRPLDLFGSLPKMSTDVSEASLGPLTSVVPPKDDPSVPGYAERIAGPGVTAMAPTPLPDFTVNPSAAPDPGLIASAPVGPTTKTDTQSSNSTSYQVPNVGEAIAQGQFNIAQEEAKAAARDEAGVRTSVAKLQADSADQEAAHLAERQAASAELASKRQDAYQKGLAEERRLYDEYHSKSTEEALPEGLGTKILGAIAMGLGAYASSMNGGPNQAAEIIKFKTQQAYQKHKDDIANARQVYVDKHGMNAEADAHFDRLETNLNTRFAAGLDSLKKKNEALQLKAGVPLEQIKASAIGAELDKQSAQFHQGIAQGLRKSVSKTVQSQTVTTTGGAGKGQGGLKEASTEDVTKVNELNEQLNDYQRLGALIQKNPKAWDEYRENQASWNKKGTATDNAKGVVGNLRGVAQLVGLADTTPEQGLKTDESKEMFRLASTLQNRLARGFGGAITEADRVSASKQLGDVAQDPKAMLKTLSMMADKAGTARQNIVANKAWAGGLQTPSAPAATKTAQDDHQGAIQWLRTEGKKSENREIALGVMKKLRAEGVIQ